MPRKKQNNAAAQRWVEMDKRLRMELPQVSSWWHDAESFGELRLKARDDGTVLAIAKGYDSAGGPVVAFGVGYDVVLALMALDGTIAGGHWRKDKPWQPK